VIRILVCAAILCCLSIDAATPPALDEQTAVQVEALNRLKGVDLESNSALKGALLKVLEKTRGTPQFVEIVRDFNLKGQGEGLLEYALKYPRENSGVEAFKMASSELEPQRIESLISSTNGTAVVQLMGSSNEKSFAPALRSVVGNSAAPIEMRKEAVRALVHSQEGAAYILKLAKDGGLSPDLRLLSSAELNRVPWAEIKTEAAQVLPLPQSQNAEPLPPFQS